MIAAGTCASSTVSFLSPWHTAVHVKWYEAEAFLCLEGSSASYLDPQHVAEFL